MGSIKWEDFSVEVLNSRHDLSDFHCKSPDLDDFIKNDALREQKCMLSRTYLFFYESSIIGFVSLSADSVSVPYLKGDDIVMKRDGSKPIYPILPCALIGRLAVVERCARRGIGAYILNWAVGLVTDVVCKSVGCRYITVDPKPESLPLYLKSELGWTQMDKKKTRYYINLYKLLNE